MNVVEGQTKKGGFNATSVQRSFEFENFLELENGKCIWSPVYTVGRGDQMTQWRLQVYPNGVNEESKGQVSVFLLLRKSYEAEVLAKCTLYIQVYVITFATSSSHRKSNIRDSGMLPFSKDKPWGLSDFISTSDILNQDYCINGTVTFGFDLTIYHQINTEPELLHPLSTNFSEHLWELFKLEELTDVTLEVGDKDVIKCHKTVLYAASAVFKTMFMNKEMLESQTGIVKARNFGKGVMTKFVEFLYRGRISDFEEAAITDLYVVGDFYQVPELVRLCEYHLMKNLSAENVLEVLCIAKNENSMLLKRGVAFLTENLDLIKEEGFSRLLESNPKLGLAINADLYNRAGFPIRPTNPEPTDSPGYKGTFRRFGSSIMRQCHKIGKNNPFK